MAPRNSYRKKSNKKLYLYAIFALILIGSTFLLAKKQDRPVAQNELTPKSPPKTIYPAQYSDKHITQNAIDTDSRFRNVTFSDQGSLMANTFSAISPTFISAPQAPEDGTWLWTKTLDITPAYRDNLIEGAKERGIKNIYISIDSYLDIFVLPDGPQKSSGEKVFRDTLENFIIEAEQNGISVDAEAGWRNWAEPGNTYKAFALLDFVKDFNNNEPYKFRGFQYDVEPYLLSAYKQDKATVLTNFTALVDKSVAFLNGSNLQFSIVVPEFYDGVSGETPKFSYAGRTLSAMSHLMRILDRRPESSIIVMAYRNKAQGADGSIAVSKDEINLADNHQTKIIIAQETGDVMPKAITFYGTSLSYYDSQVSTVRAAFGANKSFGGIATHYINSFLELK